MEESRKGVVRYATFRQRSDTVVKGEAWHRVFLLLVTLATLVCLIMAINGAKVYIDSNRSVLRDVSTSTGYIWKKESCEDLYRIVAESGESGPNSAAMEDLCETARKNGLPPVSLQSIIEERLAASSEGPSRPNDPGRVRAILEESKKQLIHELPALTAYFRPYQRQVAYMWLFIPALAFGIGAYFYARSFAPVLFAGATKRFERIMFGKSRYGDMWETFIRPKKRR